MMYELRIMDGAKIMINDKEKQVILEAKKAGLAFVDLTRTGDTVFMSTLSGIYSPDTVKKDQKTGRLWDGTKVIKKFGEWVDAASDGAVHLNYDYYPELGRDEVMTEEEYEAAQEQAKRLQAPPEVKHLEEGKED